MEWPKHWGDWVWHLLSDIRGQWVVAMDGQFQYDPCHDDATGPHVWLSEVKHIGFLVPLI